MISKIKVNGVEHQIRDENASSSIVLIEEKLETRDMLDKTLTLGYGADGKLYIYRNKEPLGTGIDIGNSTVVTGTIDSNNNLILNDNIESGNYSLYFMYSDGTYSDAMNLVVNDAIEDDGTLTGNIVPTLVDTDLTTIYNGCGYKENVRISVSGGGEVALSNVLLTGLIPLGVDGDVFHIRGVTNVAYNEAAYQGGYWCYGITGTLLNTQSGLTAISSACIGTDENGDFTITMDHEIFMILAGTAYIRFQFGLSNGEFIMTRNELIDVENDNTTEEQLGVNLLTSGDYSIQLNKRYSGSQKAYTNAPGMIALIVPMSLVLNRRIRFDGFEYGAKTTASQPLWFTLDSSMNSLGYLTDTTAQTGIWASEYLTAEEDGSYTFPVNSSTCVTTNAVYFVINMVVDSQASITEIPDTMSIVVEDIV